MKKTGQCPKCGSTEIISDAKAIDRMHGGGEAHMTVATFKNPDAFIFKGKHKTAVSAWVCAGCGFVEFYADEPAALRLK